MQKQVIIYALLLVASPAMATLTGLQISSGVLQCGVTTGNCAVTGLSFTPKAVLFWWNGQTSQNATSTTSPIGWGAAISSSNRFANYHRRTNASTTTNGRHTGAAVVTTLDSAGTINLAVDFVTMDSGGFTINVSTSPGADLFFHWMAWGGVDLTVGLKQFDSPTSTGSAAFTGMGCKADAIIFMTNGMTAAIPTTDGNSRPGFGFVDSNLNQAAIGNKQVTGANTSRRAQSTTKAIYVPDTSAMWLDANVTTIGTDGATLTWNTVQASAVHIWALGLCGLRSFVGAVNQGTGTGAVSVTAVERTPTGMLMASACKASASTDAGQQNDGVMTIGGATGAAQGNNAVATTSGGNNTGQSNYNNQLATCMTAGTPTVDAQSAFTTFDPRGFTINTGTADATNRQLIYMTMSPLPVGRMLITSWFWRIR